MSLTTVITHATGDVFPATDWNTYVRDNVNFLGVAGADLASATTITPTNAYHNVTGVITIDTVASAGAVKGQRLTLNFQGSNITVRHIGGGSGNIRLHGGLHAGFVTGEMLTLVYDGAIWQEVSRSQLHLSGESVEWNIATPPSGYIVEDGSAISRATFAALFGNIGTTHGAGDGSSTFNVPDSRGRMPVGHAPSGGHSDVATMGANDGVAVANRRPKHRHTAHAHGTPNGNYQFIGGSGGTLSVGFQGGGTFLTTAFSTTTGSVDGGSGNANDPLDSAAYIVKGKLMRV